jgi:hypothetical protein
MKSFCNYLFKEINYDSDKLSFKIKLYLNYFSKRDRLLKSISNHIIQWNKALALKKIDFLSKKDFIL